MSLLRDRRGVVALEFALVSGIVLTLMLGVFDIGRAFQAQHALNYAVEAAARGASVSSATDTAASVAAAFRSAAAPALGGCAAPGCVVTVTFQPGTPAPGGAVSVSATYQWAPLAPIDQMAAVTLTASQTLTILH